MILAFALMIVLAQAPTEPFLLTPPDVDTVNGAVGVCVRWTETDRSHVSDVVIAESSGDPKIDAEAPSMIRSIPWPVPEGYKGEWIGMGFSFSGALPRPDPDCEAFMKTSSPASGPAI